MSHSGMCGKDLPSLVLGYRFSIDAIGQNNSEKQVLVKIIKN